MKKVILFFSILMLLFGCDGNKKIENTRINSSQYSDKYNEDVEFQDGTYCAEVEYYNPSTGTRNTYNLDVEVESGELTLIHWPNGGWLDDTHFSPMDITSGECEFISDLGYHYTITLGEFGGCGYTDENKIRDEVNDDVSKTICPKCGDEKDRYDDYCYYCQKKIKDEEENKCKKCGADKFGVFEELCDRCKEQEEIER